MEATRYRHIANKTILRAPELRPGAGLGMVSQFDHPAHSSWVTMELVENEEAGLEEIRGLDCDGLDVSAMTLQVRLVHEEGRVEEVRLLPGTYSQLAYAEMISPDYRHSQRRLLEVRCGERRDYYLADSWRLTEVYRDDCDRLSPAALETLMTNTPLQDALDPTLLHVGNAAPLSRTEAVEWLRSYQRPVPAHIDPERIAMPLTDADEHPEDVTAFRPDYREYAMKTALKMDMDGERATLKAGSYRILGTASINDEAGMVEETTLLEYAGKYLLAEQHIDPDAVAMSRGDASDCVVGETEYIGVARTIESKDAAEWLEWHGKAVPVELEPHLLGKDLGEILRAKEAKEEILKDVPREFLKATLEILADRRTLQATALESEIGSRGISSSKHRTYLPLMIDAGLLVNIKNSKANRKQNIEPGYRLAVW
jgi:hypothetical protein